MLLVIRVGSTVDLMTEASKTLNALGDTYWATIAEYAPSVATVRGIHDFDDQLKSWNESDLQGFVDRFDAIAHDADSIDLSQLSLQEKITVRLLVYQCEVISKDIELRFPIAAVDPYIGIHAPLLSYSRQNTVANMDQANALLGRYQKVPTYLEDGFAFQRQNGANGMTPAAASVTRVLDQLDRYLQLPLDDDPFLQLELPESGTNWLERATKLVTETIRPAVAEYRDGLLEHIAPTARPDEKCGLMWITGGEEIYAHDIYKYTQLNETAQRIHDIGQHWATQVNAAEWVEIGEKAFAYSTMDQVFERLHNDPALRFSSEEEMLQHARTALDRAWSEVDDWFGERPDTPCDVVPVPAASAPASPPAYYMQPPVDGSRPGRYFLNTYKPEERDRFEYESIHFHEGIPGHHFDRSLASELDGIPTFRRYAQVFAHTEGWGLYSERLADEMGLYSSEVDRLGMVSADAWRAGRLVTDTGIHELGWSRQQAVEFLQRWTPIGLLTIEQEVDRYIGMPGQALSYKMGQLEIMRLRREAEETMGDKFDIKGFHNTMLVNGAMPLPMLSEAVSAWMESV